MIRLGCSPLTHSDTSFTLLTIMNTQTSTSMKTVADLIAFVVSECTAIDREERFDQMLDECYDFSAVGGPFAHMSPSSVLKECDPTAYRCGVNDYADGEGWIEIEGESYESDEVEKAREEFLDELRDEVENLQEVLSDDQANEPDERDGEEEQRQQDEIEAFHNLIRECERYTF